MLPLGCGKPLALAMGRLTYRVQADDEASAKSIADQMAENETGLGDLEDVDWEVKDPVSMRG